MSRGQSSLNQGKKQFQHPAGSAAIKWFNARILRQAHERGVMNRSDDNHCTEKARSSLYFRMRDTFHVFARQASDVLGSPLAFILAIFVIAVWAVTGPMFHFSDTWQLIINTGTTIVTFLMVFLIQNTQNRDAKAVHLKLDELIRAMQGARNQLVDLEKLSDDELNKLEEEFGRIHKRAKLSDKTVEVKSTASR
jgi:low affinity Fe/Cu permease